MLQAPRTAVTTQQCKNAFYIRPPQAPNRLSQGSSRLPDYAGIYCWMTWRSLFPWWSKLEVRSSPILRHGRELPQELLAEQPADWDSSSAEQVGCALVELQACRIVPEVTQYISQRRLSMMSQSYRKLEVI